MEQPSTSTVLGAEQQPTNKAKLSPQQRKRNQSLAKKRDRKRWSLKTPAGEWRVAEEGEEKMLENLVQVGDD